MGYLHPTEAAAVGVVYGLFVGLWFKDTYPQDCMNSGKLCLICGCDAGRFLCWDLGWAMTVLGGRKDIASGYILELNPLCCHSFDKRGLTNSGSTFRCHIHLLFAIADLHAYYGPFWWDPVWFGIVMTVELGYRAEITPPVTVNLYVGAYRAFRWTRFREPSFPSSLLR